MRKHIIIGTSAAGIGVLSKLRTLDPTSTIICISDEKEWPYNKCFLADYVAGKRQEHIYTRPEQFFKQNNIELLLDIRVTKIHPQQRYIELSNGNHLTYDTLFLGTGSYIPRPPIPCSFTSTTFILNEVERKALHSYGIFEFQTLADAQAIMNYAENHDAKHVVIVGAGLSGVECADALRLRGLQVTLVEAQQHVLSRLIDAQASQLIERHINDRGVQLYANQTVTEIKGGEHVDQVMLKSGENLNADMVIVATGLKPQNQLAIEAGLATNKSYIITNDYLQTSDEHIWAGGDCILIKDQLTGVMMPSCTWSDAMLQGITAAHGMAGIARAYQGATVITSSSFFDIQFISCGPVAHDSDDYQIIRRTGDAFYHKLLIEDDYLKGFLLVGNTEQAPRLKQYLLTRQVVKGILT